MYNYMPCSDPPDWSFILRRVSELESKITVSESQIRAIAKEFSDGSNRYTDAEIIKLHSTLNAQLDAVDKALDLLKQITIQHTEQLEFIQRKLIPDSQNASAAYTNAQIADLSAEVDKKIGNAVVSGTITDFFTGQPITIQDMLDKLAAYHLTAPITAQALADKKLTVTALTGKNITVAYLANNGGSI